MSRRVDQRAAGIAGVDCGIGLDEILETIDAELIASERAHNSEGDGAAEAKRIADGENDVTDLNGFGRSERDRGQVVALRLDHGKIGFGIAAAHMRVHLAAVGQHDFDVVGAFYDVIARQDVALGRDDDTRAEIRCAA